MNLRYITNIQQQGKIKSGVILLPVYGSDREFIRESKAGNNSRGSIKFVTKWSKKITENMQYCFIFVTAYGEGSCQ